MVKSAVLGFPRIGEGRAMKKVSFGLLGESDRSTEISEETCLKCHTDTLL